MNTCNQCNKETEKPIVRSYIVIPIESPVKSFIGKSNELLCPDCRVKAEIELRDFIKKSRYFTEVKPF